MQSINKSKWLIFYNSIRGQDWPDCENEENFGLLPEQVQKECIEVFHYQPGLFLLQNQLDENKAFCALPFLHLYIDANNDIGTCCSGAKVKEFDNSFDYENDKDFDQIRRNMLAGNKIPQCSFCYSVEEKGGISFRIQNTVEWAKKLHCSDINNFETKLIYYDIRNDNLCNLACRMCIPEWSSQLEKEYQILNWPHRKNKKNENLIDTIDFESVQKIYIAGGEPTIMPQFKRLLQTAIEKNKTNFELCVISNATNYNKQILTLLEKFANVSFTLSIDGFGNTNKYIRWPADWTAIVKNINKLKTFTNQISVNITVSIYNVFCLSPLVQFLENTLPRPVTIFLNEVIDVRMTPFNFPNKQLAIDDLIKLRNLEIYNNEEIFQNKVEYFISNLEKSSFDKSSLEKFFDYNDTLDQLRNVSLGKYLPQLEECRKYITNQI